MKFNYQTRTKVGDVQAGVVEASSKKVAIALLQKRKLFVTYLKEAGDQPFYAKKIKLFERVSRKNIVTFSRQLSIMFKSEVPLIESLQVLADQTKNPTLKETILNLLEEVKGGTLFSGALSRYPKLFSPFFISMIKSGEASGTLSESLIYIADHLEREHELYAKVQGAMIYPIMVLIVVMAVLVMMMVFVIPNLTTMLKETGQELPILTRIVIASSDFLKKWFVFLSIAFVGSLVAFFRYSRSKGGKRTLDRAVLHIPLIGSFLKMLYVSRFAENISTLVAGGLPIVKALEITKEIVGNDVYQQIISQATEDVKRGRKISSALLKHPAYFPPVFTQMVVVGERTGTLDKSLLHIVIFNQKEIDRGIESLFNILEPLLIMVLGLIVAGLMASILLPLYTMTSF